MFETPDETPPSIHGSDVGVVTLLNVRVVQVIGSEEKGDRNTTSALLAEKFDYIFFTGNHNVGRIIMEKAAKHLTPVTLELGGKNPVFITKHADLALAAKRVLCMRCFNGGQQCVSPDFVLIEKDVEEAFYEECRRVEKEWFVMARYVNCSFGNAEEEIGHIVDSRHFDTICQFYDDSKDSIERVIIGGRDKFKASNRFIPPTVLKMKDTTCPLMTEELFSPILPVFAVDSYQEGIELVNQREKPLALYVFSEKRREVEDIVFATDSGGVTVNHCVIHVVHSKLYFGGVGQSGMGGYHGKFSFDTFSHMRPVVYKTKWPGIPLISDIPLLYYPFAKWKLWMARTVMWLV